MTKNMKAQVIICLGAFVAVAATTNITVNTLERPIAKVTARIVDENGNPIADARVRFAFSGAMDDTAVVKVEGITDAQGEFTGEGHCRRDIGTSVTKDGYYESTVNLPKFKEHKDGKWQPLNPICETILRPIVKPVALYAKTVQTSVPALDESCGYDLEVGDWVAPYGKGFKSDFTFKAHRDFKDQFNFKVEAAMTFKQPDDGLLPMTSPAVARNSIFRWERFAPENGYTDSHNMYFINHDPRSGQKQEKNFDITKHDQGYFFRVRAVNQDGRIVSAHYGKITGDIAIDARDSKTCMITFTYYFNPTSLDRNLEWDTKHNLFGSLTDMESPREP